MVTPLKLIATAQKLNLQEVSAAVAVKNLLEHLGVLEESITQVLANVAVNAEANKPIQIMNPQSLAVFMAGVETIASGLPTVQDQQQKQKAVYVLNQVGIGQDGKIGAATVGPIINVGNKNSELVNKYIMIVNSYVMAQKQGRQDGNALAAAARQLQQQIDQAMRVASAPPRRPPAAAGPSTAGSSPSGNSGI